MGTSALSLRVLVVDDDRDTAEAQAMLVRLWGHEARFAHSGPEALRLVDGWTADVALLDLALPQMNGLSLAGLLRAKPGMESLTLIAITGDTSESFRKQASELGFTFYLFKPTDPEQLCQVLEALAQARGLSARPQLMPSADRVLPATKASATPAGILESLARSREVWLQACYTVARSRRLAHSSRHSVARSRKLIRQSRPLLSCQLSYAIRRRFLTERAEFLTTRISYLVRQIQRVSSVAA
jgi:CheY-like chemotaxis protein